MKCTCDFCLLPAEEQGPVVHIPPNTFLPADALPLPGTRPAPRTPQQQKKICKKRALFDGFACVRAAVIDGKVVTGTESDTCAIA